MKRLFVGTILLVAFLLPTVGHATIHEIHIMGSAFVPTKTRASYGDTVKWFNHDAFQHNSVSDPSSPKEWSSPLIPSLGTYQITIVPSDGRGPFPYSCTIHPGMDDTIFVETKHQISIIDFDFVPAGRVINPGDTVVWENTGTFDHTATSDPGSPKAWDSGLLPTTGTFQVIFTAGGPTGPFPYHCAPHPNMTDTIFTNPLYCCVGTRGNVNKSVAESPDLSDLSLLISYLTVLPRPPIPCAGEANVNAAGGIDLSDLSLLISYLTVLPRPTLPNCPA